MQRGSNGPGGQSSSVPRGGAPLFRFADIVEMLVVDSCSKRGGWWKLMLWAVNWSWDFFVLYGGCGGW